MTLDTCTCTHTHTCRHTHPLGNPPTVIDVKHSPSVGNPLLPARGQLLFALHHQRRYRGCVGVPSYACNRSLQDLGAQYMYDIYTHRQLEKKADCCTCNSYHFFMHVHMHTHYTEVPQTLAKFAIGDRKRHLATICTAK